MPISDERFESVQFTKCPICGNRIPSRCHCYEYGNNIQQVVKTGDEEDKTTIEES